MMISKGGNTLINIDLVLKKAGVSEQHKVADFGCGSTGVFAFLPAQLVGKNGKVFAIDILKPALENIKRVALQNNIVNIETVWSNLETYNATKVEPSSIDVGFLVNTLNQSKKGIDILRESIRLMKKGGRLLIVEWVDSSIPFGPELRNRVKLDLLVPSAVKLGLRHEEDFMAGQYHYGVVFTKQ